MIPQYEPVFNREQLSTDLFNYAKEDSWLTEFKKTEEFEEAIKKTVNSKNAVCVNNGTISLSLALLAEGIKAGDTVIVPALSMIATANAIRLIGAVPYFVDIEENYLCLDLELAKKAIQEPNSIKGVIYVSLNGRSHDQRILDHFYCFCQDAGVAFIEDAAQSFGSERTGTRIGNSPWLTSFSFSPAKIITTGQGGCLTTNDDHKALKIKRLKNFGREFGGGDIHHYFGVNAKFTDLQAVVGLEQIKNIETKIETKQQIFKIYKDELSECYKIPDMSSGTTPWFVDGYFEEVDKLANYLEIRGNIQTRRVYPVMSSQVIYQDHKVQVPVAERYSNRGLWLPSSLSIKEGQIVSICKFIKDFYRERDIECTSQ